MIENNEIKEHLKNTNTWLRLFYMLLFMLFLGVAINVFSIIMIFQMILSLFTGETNDRVRVFSAQLARYMYHVFLYLSYATDEKPFPFSDWPQADIDLDYDTSLPTSVDDE